MQAPLHHHLIKHGCARAELERPRVPVQELADSPGAVKWADEIEDLSGEVDDEVEVA